MYELRYFNGENEEILAKEIENKDNIFNYMKYFIERNLNAKVGHYIVTETPKYTRYRNGNFEFRLYKMKI